jgi:hypothetical protein
MATMASDGQSGSIVKSRANADRIFELYQRSSDERRALYPGAWRELDETTLCDKDVYAGLAQFLVHEYKIAEGDRNAGQRLGCDGVLGIIGALISKAAAKFKATGTDATKLFFTCNSPKETTDAAVWLQGLKRNIRRETMNRARESGAELDESAPSLYLSHTRAMNRAYSLEGSGEAALRKFALNAHQQAAGRSTEIAWLSYENMRWDPHFTCFDCDLIQQKTAKVKIVVFVAGQDRHACFILSWGDFLALDPGRAIYDPDLTPWLIPSLHHNAKPGTQLTVWVKALLPRELGGAAKYQEVAVTTLPLRASATGSRTGTINTLASCMPVELAVQATGHDLTGVSAFYEYIGADISLNMVSAIPLGGWDPLPWGHLGMGPRPATLEALVEVDARLLERCCDDLFRIDSSSPPQLIMGGCLRPAVHAALATQIMYYEQRFDAGEMRVMQTRLRNVWSQYFRPGGGTVAGDASSGMGGLAHATLITWGVLIRNAFDLGNLHLTTRASADGSAQVVGAVTGLGRSVAESTRLTLALRNELAESRRENAMLRAESRRETNSLRADVAALLGAVRGLSLANAPQAPPPPGLASPPMNAAPLPSPFAAPPHHTVPPLRAVPLVFSSVPHAPHLAAVPAAGTSPDAEMAHLGASAAASTYGAVVPYRGTTPTPITSISGVTAASLFLACQQRGGVLPLLSVGDRGRGTVMQVWFNAMATPAERNALTLKDTDGAGDRQRTAERLSVLVMRRLVRGYTDAGATVPAMFTKPRPKPLLVGAIEARVIELRSVYKHKISVSARDFAAFRAEHEGAHAGGSASAAAPLPPPPPRGDAPQAGVFRPVTEDAIRKRSRTAS